MVERGWVQRENRSNPNSQQEANIMVPEFHEHGDNFVIISTRQCWADFKVHTKNGSIENDRRLEYWLANVQLLGVSTGVFRRVQTLNASQYKAYHLKPVQLTKTPCICSCSWFCLGNTGLILGHAIVSADSIAAYWEHSRSGSPLRFEKNMQHVYFWNHITLHWGDYTRQELPA